MSPDATWIQTTVLCFGCLQALTTSVAFWYGLEAFKLRAEVVQEEVSPWYFAEWRRSYFCLLTTGLNT